MVNTVLSLDFPVDNHLKDRPSGTSFPGWDEFFYNRTFSDQLYHLGLPRQYTVQPGNPENRTARRTSQQGLCYGAHALSPAGSPLGQLRAFGPS